MVPESNRDQVTEISEEDYMRLKREAYESERRDGRSVVIVPDAVYQAERRKIARRRKTNKSARTQSRKDRSR